MIDIGSALTEAIQAIRFKKNHLYRTGWEIVQNGSQDLVAKTDASRYERMQEALETIEAMWDVLLKGGEVKRLSGIIQDGKKQGQNGDLEQGRTIDIAHGHISAFFAPKRKAWRLLIHSDWTPMVETFYDPETRIMVEFETEDAAWQWYEELEQ